MYRFVVTKSDYGNKSVIENEHLLASIERDAFKGVLRDTMGVLGLGGGDYEVNIFTFYTLCNRSHSFNHHSRYRPNSEILCEVYNFMKWIHILYNSSLGF